jgi:hypothetical protein
VSELERIGKALTPQVKGQLVGKDLAHVRRAYAMRLGQLKADAKVGHEANGRAEGADVVGQVPTV